MLSRSHYHATRHTCHEIHQGASAISLTLAATALNCRLMIWSSLRGICPLWVEKMKTNRIQTDIQGRTEHSFQPPENTRPEKGCTLTGDNEMNTGIYLLRGTALFSSIGPFFLAFYTKYLSIFPLRKKMGRAVARRTTEPILTFLFTAAALWSGLNARNEQAETAKTVLLLPLRSPTAGRFFAVFSIHQHNCSRENWCFKRRWFINRPGKVWIDSVWSNDNSMVLTAGVCFIDYLNNCQLM